MMMNLVMITLPEIQDLINNATVTSKSGSLYDIVGKLGMTYFPYAVNVLCHVLSIKDKRIGMM